MIRSVKTPGIHRAVAGTAAGLLAVAGVLTDGGAATADTTLTLRHPVMDTTHLSAPNADVPLGPGHPATPSWDRPRGVSATSMLMAGDSPGSRADNEPSGRIGI